MRERIPRSDGKYVWSKTGYQPAVATTARALWAGASDYVFPASAGKIRAVSASAADASAGTGVRTIRVFYLTDAFVEKTVDITMNGTTAVITTVADMYRINHVKTMTTGTGLATAGAISITNEAGSATYAYISAGDNESRQIIYTVPAGKILLIDDILVSNVATTSLKYARFLLMSNYCSVCDALQGGILMESFEIMLDQAVLDAHMNKPLRFPAGTDIAMKVIGIALGICSVTVRGTEE